MTDPTPPTAKELINELRGNVCRCTRPKSRGQSFCRGCYFSLPQALRGRLYRLIGAGYEEAYSEAAAIIDARLEGATP